MKKLYKLSLASLIVPAIAGVTLVSVGCPSKQSSSTPSSPSPTVPTETLPTPKLIDNPQIVANAPSVNEWWKKFNGDVSQQVQNLNQIFTPETQIKDASLVHQIIITNNGPDRFKPEIQLVPKAVFESGETIWVAPDFIAYSEIILPIPSLFTKTVTNPQLDAQSWWNELVDKEQKVAALNQILTEKTQLKTNVVARIEFKLVSLTTFTLTVYLNSGYEFINATDNWTSEPIAYSTGTAQVNVPELATITKIMDKYENEQMWWDSFTGDVDNQVKALNQIIEDGKKLIANSIQKIAFNVISPGKFYVVVSLKPKYAFTDKTTEWTSPRISYMYVERVLNIPKLVNNPTINSYQPDIASWLKSINDADPTAAITKQVNALNSILKTGTQLIADTIQRISFNVILNKFDFTVYLKPKYAFTDKTTEWTGTGITFKSVIITPKLMNHPTIRSDRPNPQAWWDSFKDDTSRIEAVNGLLSSATQLKFELVSTIKFIPTPNDPSTFKITVDLKSNYQFDGDTSSWTSDPIKFIVNPSPNPIAKVKVIYRDFNTPQEWWNSFNSDLDKELKALNDLLTSKTALPRERVKNFQFTQLGTNNFSVAINLSSPYVFENNSLPTMTLDFEYNIPVTVPIPKIDQSYTWYAYKGLGITNATDWWKAYRLLDPSGVSIFNQACTANKLDVTYVKSITVKDLGNLKYQFVVTLNKGCTFTSGSDTWTGPVMTLVAK